MPSRARRAGPEQRAAGRKPGKQPGSPGAFLRQVEHPDAVIDHAPVECGGCGASLTEAPVVGTVRRQVFDLPPSRVQVVEHRLQRRSCGCGAVTTAPAPAGAGAPAVYGAGLRALAVYLLHAQHLPLARTAILLREVFDLPVSEGFLTRLLTDAGTATDRFLEQARAELIAAPVAHFDETGVRVDGRLRWLHSASTDQLTLLNVSAHRGGRGIDELGVLPSFTGVAVHDGWAPYPRYDRAEHALCNAHHLRELTAVLDRDPAQTWASDLAELLVEAHRTTCAARAGGQAALDRQVLGRLQLRYDELITAAKTAHPPPPPTGERGAPRLGPTGGLIKRLDTRRDQVLRFATDLNVPFTNNQAERDLRMAKLQMKISGCWRTFGGAETFCALRSYVASVRKNGIHVLDALTTLLGGDPWLPAPA